MKYFRAFALGVVSLFTAAAAHALPILTTLSVDVDPATGGIQTSRTVQIGSTFSIDVRIDNVTGLFAYDIDVDYDSAKLDATNVSEGPFLAGGGSTFFDAPLPAQPVNAVATLLGIVGVSGSGVLYSIQYTALALGVSPLDFTFTDLVDDQFNPISPGLAGGSITVVAQLVALPSTLALLLGGSIILAAVRRLRKRG